ncbi:hypothetical protein [Alsobacter soli]|uniref:hypothetical protein n=1 Tax=Alsobacter soli TaxID=2109933 RepID=UPI0011B24255|nr:hypothetical protein [Alsobacter soli]
MNASRILPTVAFSVAVSFFFIPPVVAVVKRAPEAKPSATPASLVVKRETIAAAPKARTISGTCAPADAAASSSADGKRSPWNPWVVASLTAE